VKYVIPANAGIHSVQMHDEAAVDPGVRRDDIRALRPAADREVPQAAGVRFT